MDGRKGGEGERGKEGKKKKCNKRWRRWLLNQGPSACEADTNTELHPLHLLES